jgi:hypothetical protein
MPLVVGPGAMDVAAGAGAACTPVPLPSLAALRAATLGRGVSYSLAASGPGEVREAVAVLAAEGHDAAVVAWLPAAPSAAGAAALGKRSLLTNDPLLTAAAASFLSADAPREAPLLTPAEARALFGIGAADLPAAASGAAAAAAPTTPYSKRALFDKYVFVNPAIFMGLPVVLLLAAVVLIATSLLAGIQTPTRFEGRRKEK